MTGPVSVLIETPVVAAVAAYAARSTPGVVRLEPGVRGLVTTLVRAGRQRWLATDPAPSEGVRVRRTEMGRLLVQVDVVISGDRHAGEVGRAVQREVAAVVRAQTGQDVDEVVVSILDIEPEPR
ncbi:Asp23/Gls24 family envelope stress response protein [Nocardia cyriacigeorgica]|uniref:Asp23/Gls24 family envelope stress response protein n=1 Tax=Nocardia cyriacigeorgica TaxID=135487 RepID=A0A6P1D3Z7_9NOCA|nr:Asp23/Gls24 family envelope stress response protein [Nocardia cyriacigeorgica]NEW40952.1 Asp23/Gls24 family envelope stress response protein [Nocardia cyriacigeorgica]NEW44259.1 Asp23/Gls24 family envelope stress response protein [Nocardia cyriacigeorgica]NEW51242.1 Asp23/Gls24 family envelope stress response protein [Nocardia cyriacigeorgica]NEW59161.1 Asp23/Gls24 family envelope stress response protein [Nocardia cyriacigeorgica]